MNDYERIARAIRYIEDNLNEQPGLGEIAEEVGMSVSHFHRMFRRWAGITPKNFLQHLTAIEAKQLLSNGTAVLDTALDVGLSGPGRLHDLCVNFEAASPGEIASKGKGWEIRAGFADTPFGEALIAQSPRGICRLEFLNAEDARDTALMHTQTAWSGATFIRDDESAAEAAKGIFPAQSNTGNDPIQVLVKGTKFQVKVWRALLSIGNGELSTYAEIAERIQSPKAHRAVGSAIGKNELAYLIPCHRVIQSTGGLGEYRWGKIRKKSMIAFEHARKTEGMTAAPGTE